MRGRGDAYAAYRIALAIATFYMLFTAPLSWNTYDISYFIDWARAAERHGLLGVYRYAEKVAYPPLAVISFLASHYAAAAAGLEPMTAAYRLAVKLWLYLVFLAITLVLKKEYGPAAAVAWMAGYIVYAVYNGYQFDFYTALGILFSHIYVYRRPAAPGNRVLAGFWLGFAAMYKQAAAIFAPLHIIHMAGRGERRCVAAYLAGAAAASSIAIPFILYDPASFLYKTMFFHGKRLPQGLSPWALPLILSGYWGHGTPVILTWIWEPVFLAGYAVILLLLMDRRGERAGLYGAVAIHLWFMLTGKVGNIPYLLWTYPLVAAALAEKWSGGGFKYPASLVYAVQALAAYLYPFIYMTVPALAWGSIYIVEDEAWRDASLFYQSFFAGTPLPGPRASTFYARYAAAPTLLFLYTHRFLLEALTVSLYLGAVSALLVYVLGEARRG